MTRIRQLTLAALTSLLVAGTALAEPPKVAPPPPGDPVDYALPAKTRFTLANGIPVTLVPFGEVPKLSIVVRVRTGNIDEGDRTWLADLAGELMKEATENFTGPEISRRAASLGGRVGVGLEGVVVGRGDGRGSHGGELIEHGDAEGGAFGRIGAGAELVEEHQ
jgi:hypothetical protein